MNVNNDSLREKIEKQRGKLKKVAANKRLENKEVQQESEKLDELINRYFNSTPDSGGLK